MKKLFLLVFMGVGFIYSTMNRINILFEENTTDVGGYKYELDFYMYNDLGLEVICRIESDDDVNLDNIITLYTLKSNSFSRNCNTPLVLSARLIDYEVTSKEVILDFNKKMYYKEDDLKLVSKTIFNFFDSESVIFKINGEMIYKYS